MKREMMSILVCPVCKGRLDLDVILENEIEVISGTLFCSACNYSYQIKDTIPDLLPPENKP